MRTKRRRTRSLAGGRERGAPPGADDRRLEDLVSVGPAIRRDLEKLGIHDVRALARRSPKRLYDDLCRATRRRQDPCVLDTFRAAVAQAQDPDLPIEYCVWWYWSRVRKGEVPRGLTEETKKGRK